MYTLLLACLILLGLTACGDGQILEETTPKMVETFAVFAFPEDTVVCGVNIGGMSAEAACNAVSAKAAGYELILTVNGTVVNIPGSEMELAFDAASFAAFCAAAKNGEAELPGEWITYDAGSVQKMVSAAVEPAVVDAAVAYSAEEGKFVCVPAGWGAKVDLDAVMAAVDQAVLSLRGEVSVDVRVETLSPKIASDDARVTEALAAANAYLRAAPEYVYTMDRGETVTEPLTKETIASFVRIAEDLSVSIDQTAVQDYAGQMGSLYSREAHSGDFLTTGGNAVALAVDYNGRCVDTEALAADICACLTGGISGTRKVPYSQQSDVVELAYGGNYVEIDLSAQQLWVYKGGDCVVSTPIVSGCVAEGKFTPNGVYAIYEKDRDCWLTGPTWRDYVEYWMAFYKGFGIHDASWRSEFGGDIYIYEGSHGCPNLPPDAAEDVYYNAPLGTKVILYGGEVAAEQLTQEITGTTVYEAAADTAPFKLDVALKYEGAEISYRSSNPQVASVAADGTVTVTGPGSAMITVVAAGFTFHSGASMTVQIRVNQ